MAIRVPDRPSILVIDDERGPRESMRILLKNAYNVYCADSVDDGISILRDAEPEAVVMDIRMPRKTGLEGLAELRQVDPHVSVVMLTGFGTLESAQEAIRLGANDYVRKPFDAREMEDVIRRNVQRTRLHRTHANAEKELTRLNRQLLDELDRKETMAALGQKSAELVHDLRNPLTVVMGCVELLASELRQAESELGPRWTDTQTYIEMIEKSVLRCKDLADMWLSLGRRDTQRMKPVQVRRLVEEVVDSLSPMAQAQGVRIEMAEGDDSEIAVDSVQMLRALHNILTNGIEAVAVKHGVIRISCHRQGSHAEIRFEDNGCGMTRDQAARVFEPYFTTKEFTGTGLGLFITKKVVETHHGTIDLESEPNVGTAISIRIPILDRPEIAIA